QYNLLSSGISFLQQGELSSLAVGTYSGSGNFITGSGNALCILFPRSSVSLKFMLDNEDLKQIDTDVLKRWISNDSEDENVFESKKVKKTVKPSLEKIEFVNARNTTVENENKAEKPRKFSQSLRGNKRNWNSLTTQKLEDGCSFS
nr:hypothetical protein [Tanacetum cinerariifolium]